jgi:hypothetical protein
MLLCVTSARCDAFREFIFGFFIRQLINYISVTEDLLITANERHKCLIEIKIKCLGQKLHILCPK